MPTDNRIILLGRTAVLAMAVVVPIISTAAMPAYADNESAAAIEPPYHPPSREAPPANSRLPAPHATTGASAGAQEDEHARDIYKPGLSDR
jgi:hypothetical protein